MEYETIVSEYVDYGKNKFLEISKKKVIPDDVEFLNISKGYYTPDGQKRYQNAIGFPLDKEIAKSLIDKIKSVIQLE
jgi:hypothetical protein